MLIQIILFLIQFEVVFQSTGESVVFILVLTIMSINARQVLKYKL